MRNLFESELLKFNEEAKLFSKKHPEYARSLNLEAVKDRDPNVERLLEGMAFLCAQIRDRIEDDFPEVCETFLRQNWSSLLGGFPSGCIAEFKPDFNFLLESTVVPAKTRIRSQPVGPEHTVCFFQTTSVVEIVPVEILKTKVMHFGQNKTKISLQFQLPNSLTCESDEIQRIKKLRLYLYTGSNYLDKLYHYLLTKTEIVEVASIESKQSVLLGGQSVITPTFNTLEDLTLKSNKRESDSLHFLTEFFAFPEKQYFVEIGQWGKIKQLGESNQFYLNIILSDKICEEISFNQDLFKVNCVPMINSYPASTEPVRYDNLKSEYPIRVNSHCVEGTIATNLEQVIGVDDRGQRYHYTQMQDFNRTYDQTLGCYSIASKRLHREFPQLYISIVDNREFEPIKLSCIARVHNGHLPREFLQKASLQGGSDVLSEHVKMTNLIRPTRCLMPPSHKTYPWLLLSALNVTVNNLAEVKQLQFLLELLDWKKTSMTKRIYENVIKVKLNTYNKIKKGIVYTELEYKVVFGEQAFLDESALFVFGLTLQKFLCSVVPVNYYLSLVLVRQPCESEIYMPADVGRRQVI